MSNHALVTQSRSLTFQESCFYFNENHFKNSENCFLFHARSAFRYLYFHPDFLVRQKNSLIRGVQFISKFMTPQAGHQINTIHILHNISISKGNQTMKFGQLIEYNSKNIFLEKSFTKCGVEASPDLFIKYQDCAYLWIDNLKCYKVCFFCISKSRSTKIYQN